MDNSGPSSAAVKGHQKRSHSSDSTDKDQGAHTLTKQRKRDESYNSSGLRRSLHGVVYQINLLMLFVHRASKKGYDFSLATEMDEAEKFDDIVFRYKDEKDKVNWRFLQAKHKQDPEKTKITVGQLKSSDNDFSLEKYFISYCKIMMNDRFKEAICKDFTIITNTDFAFRAEEESKQSKNDKEWNDYFDYENLSSVDKILYFENEHFNAITSKFKSNDQDSCLFNNVKDILLANIISRLENLTKDNALYTKCLLGADIDLVIEKLKKIQKIAKFKYKKAKAKKIYKNLKNIKDIVGFVEEFKRFLDEIDGVLKEHKDNDNNKEQRKKIEEVRGQKRNTNVGKTFWENICGKNDNIDEKATPFLNYVGNVITDCTNKLREYDNSNEYKSFIKKLSEDQKFIEKISNETNTESIKNQIEKNSIFRCLNVITNESKPDEMKIKLKQKLQIISSEITVLQLALDERKFDEQLQDFLGVFRFVIKYPDEEKLYELIGIELKQKFELMNAGLMCATLKTEMMCFLKKKNGIFFTSSMAEEFFNEMNGEIKNCMISGLSRAYTEKLERYGIQYESNLKELNDFINQEGNLGSNVQSIFHLRTKITQLSAIKVNNTLKNCKVISDSCIFIRYKILQLAATQTLVSDAIDSKNVKFCVIECRIKKGYVDLPKNILDKITTWNGVKLILIADSQTEFVKNDQLEEIKPVNDEHIGFTYLNSGSQENVLGKNVNFQGKEIKFNEIIKLESAKKIIDETNLLKLIKGKELRLGNEESFKSIGYVEDYYIPRRFNLEKVDPQTNEKEKFIYEENELVEFDLNENQVIILTDDPGAGKSTVLTSLAKQMHEDKDVWIVRINLNDHVQFLANISENYTGIFNRLSEIVISDKQANVQLERSLFKKGLECGMPQIKILFDGFDEICSTHEKQTIKLMLALKETKVLQLWITSRTHEEKNLEDKLKSIAYHFEYFNKNDQKKFSDRFWKWNLKNKHLHGQFHNGSCNDIIKNLKELQQNNSFDEKLKNDIYEIVQRYSEENLDDSEKLRSAIEKLSFIEYAGEMLEQFGKETDNKEFSIVPLHLRMLTEVVFEQKLKLNLKGLGSIYDTFIEMKFKIFKEEKAKAANGNLALNVAVKYYLDAVEKIHHEFSLKELFEASELAKLPLLRELDKFNAFFGEEECCLEKAKEELARIGLLTINLKFVHRSYAEYFVTKYLIKNFDNFEVQIFLLSYVPKHKQVYKFFNEKITTNTTNIKFKVNDFERLDFSQLHNINKGLCNTTEEGHVNIINVLLESIKSSEKLELLMNNPFRMSSILGVALRGYQNELAKKMLTFFLDCGFEYFKELIFDPHNRDFPLSDAVLHNTEILKFILEKLQENINDYSQERKFLFHLMSTRNRYGKTLFYQIFDQMLCQYFKSSLKVLYDQYLKSYLEIFNENELDDLVIHSVYSKNLHKNPKEICEILHKFYVNEKLESKINKIHNSLDLVENKRKELVNAIKHRRREKFEQILNESEKNGVLKQLLLAYDNRYYVNNVGERWTALHEIFFVNKREYVEIFLSKCNEEYKRIFQDILFDFDALRVAICNSKTAILKLLSDFFKNTFKNETIIKLFNYSYLESLYYYFDDDDCYKRVRYFFKEIGIKELEDKLKSFQTSSESDTLASDICESDSSPSYESDSSPSYESDLSE